MVPDVSYTNIVVYTIYVYPHPSTDVKFKNCLASLGGKNEEK